MRRERVQLACACAVVVAAFLWEGREPIVPFDDAFISFRYARNLAEGHGLVYNVGEYVEGITNLAWTLLVAGGIRLGFEAPAVAHALELVFGSWVLGVSAAFAAALLGTRRSQLAALAPLLVLAQPSFPIWSLSGLGEILFVAACTSAFAAHALAFDRCTIAAALLATYARPEGVLVAAVVLAARLIEREDRRKTFEAIAAYGAGAAALVAFRLAYYGSPVPNTFYAKVGGIPLRMGVDYLTGFLANGVAPLVALALPAFWSEPRSRPVLVWCALTAIYVVSIGGDGFAQHRFLLPVLPGLAAVAVAGAVRVAERGRVQAALAYGSVVASLTISVLGPPTTSGWPPSPLEGLRSTAIREHREFCAALRDRGQLMAQRLRELAVPGDPPPLVAASAIGSFGYYSRLPVLDMLGLVEPAIARRRSEAPAGAVIRPGHIRSNADYVMRRQPEFILTHFSARSADYPALVELRSRPDFDASYVWDGELTCFRRRTRTGE